MKISNRHRHGYGVFACRVLEYRKYSKKSIKRRIENPPEKTVKEEQNFLGGKIMPKAGIICSFSSCLIIFSKRTYNSCFWIQSGINFFRVNSNFLENSFEIQQKFSKK